jgi:hypothetical protein
VRLAAPSPKATISPPTTIATTASPVAMGPVKAVCRTWTPQDEFRGGIGERVSSLCGARRLPGRRGNKLKVVQVLVVLGIVRHQRRR